MIEKMKWLLLNKSWSNWIADADDMDFEINWMIQNVLGYLPQKILRKKNCQSKGARNTITITNTIYKQPNYVNKI